MDFLDRLTDYIESNIALSTSIKWGVLSAESNSIAIRQAPSSNVDRYADKGKTFAYSFQILVKNTSILTAMNEIQAIADLLDELVNDAIVSQNASFKFIRCEVTTLPNWVEKTDHNEHIYTALFSAELEKGGN